MRIKLSKNNNPAPVTTTTTTATTQATTNTTAPQTAVIGTPPQAANVVRNTPRKAKASVKYTTDHWWDDTI